MDNRLIGGQITKYRKERNLTQEELGRAVGVSTQAVSRWENGGAPDVALLPAIADKLGVTIDALFGRENGERVDIHDAVAKWLAGVPDKERYDHLCRLNWTAFKHLTAGYGKLPNIDYLEKCEQASDPYSLMTCQAWLEGGFMLDVHAEDMSFASVWPRPAAGYAAYFSSRDQYRRLFAALARPGCLETLEYMQSQTYRLYAPGTVAKALGTPAEEISAVMAELAEINVLRKLDLQMEDGMSCVYAFSGVELVPFLYFARCMMQHGTYMICLGGGDQVLLDGTKQKDEKEKADEKK